MLEKTPESSQTVLERNDFEPWAAPLSNTRIKWGSVTRLLPDRPGLWSDVEPLLGPVDRDPRPHDVMVGRIVVPGRHSGIEQDSGRKAKFYLGDLVGVAFGHRYATRQFEGDVPPQQPLYHMLSQAGVCGRVVSAASTMSEPTMIEPLGFLLDEEGQPANLSRYALRKRNGAPRVKTIVIVGSSMDAGKTRTASSIIHGLAIAGHRVNAGKLTGTCCAKDTNQMLDAGATRVLDFNDAGFASTFRESEQVLAELCEVLISQLSADRPDYLVLEIADGVIQRETKALLSYLTTASRVDHVCLAVHDALAGPTCVDLLRSQWKIEPTLLSGVATISPLSTAEVAGLVDIPCLSADELAEPNVERFFRTNGQDTSGIPELPTQSRVEMTV